MGRATPQQSTTGGGQQRTTGAQHRARPRQPSIGPQQPTGAAQPFCTTSPSQPFCTTAPSQPFCTTPPSQPQSTTPALRCHRCPAAAWLSVPSKAIPTTAKKIAIPKTSVRFMSIPPSSKSTLHRPIGRHIPCRIPGLPGNRRTLPARASSLRSRVESGQSGLTTQSNCGPLWVTKPADSAQTYTVRYQLASCCQATDVETLGHLRLKRPSWYSARRPSDCMA
jgi:hypothetical protein